MNKSYSIKQLKRMKVGRILLKMTVLELVKLGYRIKITNAPGKKAA